MRQQLDEPREVRKEAAVIARVVCCGVPGLFCVPFSKTQTESKIFPIVNGFRLHVMRKTRK